MPQGLKNGGLYSNNFISPLTLNGQYLVYKNDINWETKSLIFDELKDYHNIFNNDIGTLDKIDPNIKHVTNFGKLKPSSFMSTHLDQQETKKIKLKENT